MHALGCRHKCILIAREDVAERCRQNITKNHPPAKHLSLSVQVKKQQLVSCVAGRLCDCVGLAGLLTLRVTVDNREEGTLHVNHDLVALAVT